MLVGSPPVGSAMRVDYVTAGTIGLLSDTHDEFVDWAAVLSQIAAALDGVEVILHCGDITPLAAIGQLGEIAPVLAVRSAADPPGGAARARRRATGRGDRRMVRSRGDQSRGR
jgi:predicted phosphodiesterase